MTLPALDEWIATGTTGPKYTVGPKCANPNCERWAEHAHHILRRSYLAGVYAWVDIDGWVVGNLTGLCPPCHDDVTGKIGGHKAAIRIDLETKTFWWCLLRVQNGEIVEYVRAGLLDPQPPTPESVSIERASGHEGSDACPTCGHIRRRRSSPSAAGRRRRRKWIVQVPDDEAEHGADVLDTLIEGLVPVVPSGDTSTTGRYYVLVPVLAYATMNIKNFVETMKGVGG